MEIKMFKKLEVYREIFLTEAKPVLISPRSPRKGSDCSPLAMSELAIAGSEPCRARNPKRVENFSKLLNDALEEVKLSVRKHFLSKVLFLINSFVTLHWSSFWKPAR